VGLWDNVRTVLGWSREAYARGPRWGRIVEVGRKLGPLTRIIVEIHYGHDEPFEHSTWTWVPRGVEPEVGQDAQSRNRPESKRRFTRSCGTRRRITACRSMTPRV
jgi:hypothetical protein